MSKPSAAKRTRQARRSATSRRRAQRTHVSRTPEQNATRLVECLERWKRLPIGERFQERCPFCAVLVLVTNKADDSDVSHALPMCELWTVGLLALGAHSPRIERHR